GTGIGCVSSHPRPSRAYPTRIGIPAQRTSAAASNAFCKRIAASNRRPRNEVATRRFCPIPFHPRGASYGINSSQKGSRPYKPATGRAHGYAIAQSIELRSKEVLQVGHGSLYPALQRLLKQGLIVAEDGQSDNNRKARFYRLTAKGRRQLFLETSKWQQFS